ncbi:hypothetical protein ACWGQ5_52010, partial [Streptomyces sp. NPDC055722]
CLRGPASVAGRLQKIVRFQVSLPRCQQADHRTGRHRGASARERGGPADAQPDDATASAASSTSTHMPHDQAG